MWGQDHLRTLLDYYGEPKVSRTGERLDPLVDPDAAIGEFLPFKRAVSRLRGEMTTDDQGQPRWHTYQPPELMQKMFGGPNAGNQQVFQGLFFAKYLYTLFSYIMILIYH